MPCSHAQAHNGLNTLLSSANNSDNLHPVVANLRLPEAVALLPRTCFVLHLSLNGLYRGLMLVAPSLLP